MAMSGKLIALGYFKHLAWIGLLSILLSITQQAWSGQTNYGVNTGIPGTWLVGSWTYSGIGTIYLEYESGHVCYKTSKRCYDFNASFCFRQVGSAFCGSKIYVDTFFTVGGEIWLEGSNVGGIKLLVISQSLPFYDQESDVYLSYSPDDWDGN